MDVVTPTPEQILTALDAAADFYGNDEPGARTIVLLRGIVERHNPCGCRDHRTDCVYVWPCEWPDDDVQAVIDWLRDGGWLT